MARFKWSLASLTARVCHELQEKVLDVQQEGTLMYHRSAVYTSYAKPGVVGWVWESPGDKTVTEGRAPAGFLSRCLCRHWCLELVFGED